MAISSKLCARVFAVPCLVGAALSIAKTIRIFSQNPRELGSPRGAAEDWLQESQSVVERNEFENTAMAAVFLGTGVGIYCRRAWGHTLCLIVSVLLGLGGVGYLVTDGLNWKLLVGLAVVASVIVWLRFPVVRYRLKEGSAQ
jgi:hypothetical protein